MKKFFSISIICFIVLFAFDFAYGQVPKKFNYQAVARDINGKILSNQAINIKASYHVGSLTGNIYYWETFQDTTNQFGLFTLQLGTSTHNNGGPFSNIPFASQDIYLEIGLDATGGTNFITMGTTQFITVPYAIVADTALHVAASSSGNVQTDNTLSGSGTSGNPLKLAQQNATNGQVLQWNNSTWEPVTLSGGSNYTAGAGIGIAGNVITNTSLNTDAQTLTLTGNSLSISNGNAVILPAGGLGTVTSIATGTGLTGGTITTNGTISAQNTTALWNANQLQGIGVSSTSPTSGQMLQYNGSTWVPVNANTGVIGPGTANYVSKFTGTNTVGNSLIFDDGTYVGIGTTNPQNLLDVTSNTGNIGILGGFTNNGSGAAVGLQGSCNYGLNSGVGVKGYGGVEGVEGDGPTALAGYGTATGTGTCFGVYGDASGGATAYGIYGSAESATTNWAGYFRGPTFCTSGVWQSSDRKLKNNIQPLSGALAIINRLNPSVYTFKTTEYKQMNLPEGLQYGLIADEVQLVVPGAVRKTVQPAEYENHDEKKGKKLSGEVEFNAVNYTEMIPILIAGIKEQQATIEDLQKQIELLKQQLQQLQKQ